MAILPDPARNYILQALEGTPVVVDRLLLAAREPDFDRRPDPERFTLREVIAHLADWDPVWLERIERMRLEENPELPSYDEGQWALDHDYAHAVITGQQERFRAGRRALVARLRSLTPEEWERTCRHAQWGDLSISSLAVLVLGHDGYHTRQISEWLNVGV